MKGLHVRILFDECATRGPLFSGPEPGSALLVGPGVAGVFDQQDDVPTYRLAVNEGQTGRLAVMRDQGNEFHRTVSSLLNPMRETTVKVARVKAVLLDADGNDLRPDGCVGPMFSGYYLTTSDSRFPCETPIPCHDRFESPAKLGAEVAGDYIERYGMEVRTQ